MQSGRLDVLSELTGYFSLYVLQGRRVNHDWCHLIFLRDIPNDRSVLLFQVVFVPLLVPEILDVVRRVLPLQYDIAVVVDEVVVGCCQMVERFIVFKRRHHYGYTPGGKPVPGQPGFLRFVPHTSVPKEPRVVNDDGFVHWLGRYRMTACRQYGHCTNQNRSHEILPAADVDFDVNFLIRYSEGILAWGSPSGYLQTRAACGKSICKPLLGGGCLSFIGSPLFSLAV